jgi:hypothetical protein
MKTIWIAEVKWKDGKSEFFGPFTEYDMGIKVWSAEFSADNSGKFEWIDYHILNQDV